MATPTTTIIVSGASGRMGVRLCNLAARDPSFRLAAALARPGSPAIGRAASPIETGQSAPVITDATDAPADVVIDFSSDLGARAALSVAASRSAALLVGTTGLSDQTMAMLRDAAQRLAILVAPNTSMGVAAAADAAARLARSFGPEFRASIVEAHHIHKKDAPSGTALRLARAIRDVSPESARRLPDDQVLSIRAGDIVGEHTIRFAGPGEVIELTHRATTRDVFALGALRAARWLHGREAGWWTIEDVLGFTRS